MTDLVNERLTENQLGYLLQQLFFKTSAKDVTWVSGGFWGPPDEKKIRYYTGGFRTTLSTDLGEYHFVIRHQSDINVFLFWVTVGIKDNPMLIQEYTHGRSDALYDKCEALWRILNPDFKEVDMFNSITLGLGENTWI